MTTVLKYTGEIPSLQKPVLEVCRDVFELLSSDEATIYDLSLPPRANMAIDFALTMNTIRFNFHLMADDSSLPESQTRICFDDHEIVANVLLYYTAMEVTMVPDVVLARILHEATHAIRRAIIHLSNKEGVDMERRMTSTPPKDRMSMMYEAARGDLLLYMLEGPAFHSGHYVEHKLLGGVWMQLQGYILDGEDQPQELGSDGMVLKVVRKGNKRNVRMGHNRGFAAFVRHDGYDQEGAYREIYFFDPCRRCSRDL